MSKSPDAFRTISEVAEWLGVQAHVLRFWESKFSHVKPVKRAGGRRYYRPSDMQLLGGIKKLLHDDGLTIKGVQKILREQGVGHVSDLSQPLGDSAETLAAEPVAESSVLKFRGGRGKTEDIEDATLLDDDDEPEDTAPGSDATGTTETAPESPPQDHTGAEPLPEPMDTAADASPLPSFMHRSATDRAKTSAAPEAVTESVSSEPATKRARVVDAPDPPDETDLPYSPGVMAHLAELEHLSPEQITAIAPVVRDLRAWLARASDAGAA